MRILFRKICCFNYTQRRVLDKFQRKRKFTKLHIPTLSSHQYSRINNIKESNIKINSQLQQKSYFSSSSSSSRNDNNSIFKNIFIFKTNFTWLQKLLQSDNVKFSFIPLSELSGKRRYYQKATDNGNPKEDDLSCPLAKIPINSVEELRQCGFQPFNYETEIQKQLFKRFENSLMYTNDIFRDAYIPILLFDNREQFENIKSKDNENKEIKQENLLEFITPSLMKFSFFDQSILNYLQNSTHSKNLLYNFYSDKINTSSSEKSPQNVQQSEYAITKLQSTEDKVKTASNDEQDVVKICTQEEFNDAVDADLIQYQLDNMEFIEHDLNTLIMMISGNSHNNMANNNLEQIKNIPPFSTSIKGFATDAGSGEKTGTTNKKTSSPDESDCFPGKLFQGYHAIDVEACKSSKDSVTQETKKVSHQKDTVKQEAQKPIKIGGEKIKKAEEKRPIKKDSKVNCQTVSKGTTGKETKKADIKTEKHEKSVDCKKDKSKSKKLSKGDLHKDGNKKSETSAQQKSKQEQTKESNVCDPKKIFGKDSISKTDDKKHSVKVATKTKCTDKVETKTSTDKETHKSEKVEKVSKEITSDKGEEKSIGKQDLPKARKSLCTDSTSSKTPPKKEDMKSKEEITKQSVTAKTEDKIQTKTSTETGKREKITDSKVAHSKTSTSKTKKDVSTKTAKCAGEMKKEVPKLTATVKPDDQTTKGKTSVEEKKNQKVSKEPGKPCAGGMKKEEIPKQTSATKSEDKTAKGKTSTEKMKKQISKEPAKPCAGGMKKEEILKQTSATKSEDKTAKGKASAEEIKKQKISKEPVKTCADEVKKEKVSKQTSATKSEDETAKLKTSTEEMKMQKISKEPGKPCAGGVKKEEAPKQTSTITKEDTGDSKTNMKLGQSEKSIDFKKTISEEPKKKGTSKEAAKQVSDEVKNKGISKRTTTNKKESEKDIKVSGQSEKSTKTLDSKSTVPKQEEIKSTRQTQKIVKKPTFDFKNEPKKDCKHILDKAKKEEKKSDGLNVAPKDKNKDVPSKSTTMNETRIECDVSKTSRHKLEYFSDSKHSEEELKKSIFGVKVAEITDSLFSVELLTNKHVKNINESRSSTSSQQCITLQGGTGAQKLVLLEVTPPVKVCVMPKVKGPSQSEGSFSNDTTKPDSSSSVKSKSQKPNKDNQDTKMFSSLIPVSYDLNETDPFVIQPVETNEKSKTKLIPIEQSTQLISSNKKSDFMPMSFFSSFLLSISSVLNVSKNTIKSFQLFSTNPEQKIDEVDLEKDIKMDENENALIKTDTSDKNPKESQGTIGKIAQIVGCRELKVIDCPVPKINDYEVLIKVHACGITSADLYMYNTGGKNCQHVMLGHEAAGVVEKVGKCITHLQVGDHVAVEPGICCGLCHYCKRGKYNLCPNTIYLGSMGTYTVHPGDLCHKLPKSMNMDDGALVHPVALAAHACKKAEIDPRSQVLIIGSCPMALSSVMCAKAMGASQVSIIDVAKKNLDIASSKLGADHSILVEAAMTADEMCEHILEKTKCRPNVVIVISGCTKSFHVASKCCERGGVIILAGCHSQSASFNILQTLSKEINILSSFRSCNDYPTAINLISMGKAQPSSFITHHFPLNNIKDAFETIMNPNKEAIKVVIKCQD